MKERVAGLNMLTLMGAAVFVVERKCYIEFVVELDWGRVLLFACGVVTAE